MTRSSKIQFGIMFQILYKYLANSFSGKISLLPEVLGHALDIFQAVLLQCKTLRNIDNFTTAILIRV